MSEKWNDDPSLMVSALLSAHEFLLEVVVARELARMPLPQSEMFVSEMIRISRKSYGPITGDPEQIERMQQVQAMLETSVEKFFAKAARRARDIQERTAQGPLSPRED